ncbi:MAG: amylo-alpha-1,6-glucosidase [Gemmatimonadaceae bacterium]
MRVLLVGDVASDEEAAAAAAWLGARYNDWAVVAPSMVAADQIDTADVVWCHWASVPARTLIPDSLLQRIRGRGGVLLTLCACELPYHAGIEPTAPEVATGKFTCAGDPLWSPAFHDWPDFPHVRGLQGWDMRRHPLFAGFVGGTFSRRLREGDSFCELGYSWPRWPLHVIAVERAYVQLHEERALAWEYAVPDRRVLCIGAHVALHSGAELQEQRDRLLMNALAHAASPLAPGEVAFWPARRERARVPEVAVGLTAPNPDRDVSDVDRMVGSAQPVPFTLAGRRALVVGTEQAGIQDIWLHPYCVVSDGLRVTMDDRPVIATDVEIAPVDVVRRLKGSITERIIPSIDSSVVRLEYDGALSPGLRVGFRVPLRLEWPYAPTALAPLAWARRTLDDGRVLVTICGADGASVAVLLFDGASSVHVEDVDGAPDVLVSARQRQLTITIAAGDGVTSIEEALRRSHDARRARAHHFADLDANTVSMQSPDARLDASLRWAVRRLDMFVADTPEGGQSLMAGYAASRSGWSRSRPGYAWFFGRDACWSADAMLAAGMFAEVREVIRHLAATRDVTGKIYHELTTSGVCHYDAADSTPLFLRLVGRYFDWTGDRATVRDAWPAVQEAFAFCCSTDRDGDGLPENSSIGHGWIESGPLGGGS